MDQLVDISPEQAMEMEEEDIVEDASQSTVSDVCPLGMFSCDSCVIKPRFQTVRMLEEHIAVQHFCFSPYECRECTLFFGTEPAIVAHFRHVHGQQKFSFTFHYTPDCVDIREKIKKQVERNILHPSSDPINSIASVSVKQKIEDDVQSNDLESEVDVKPDVTKLLGFAPKIGPIDLIEFGPNSIIHNADTFAEVMKRNDELNRLKEKRESKQIECKQCGVMVCPLTTSLIYHVNKHHTKLPLFECSACNKTWTTSVKSDVVKHVQTHHHGDESLIINHKNNVREQIRSSVHLCFPECRKVAIYTHPPAETCPLIPASKTDSVEYFGPYDDPKRSDENEQNTVECQVCNMRVNRDWDRRFYHVNVKHSRLTLFECSGCGQKWCTPKKQKIIEHVMKHHDGDKSLIIDHKDRVRPQLKEFVQLCFPMIRKSTPKPKLTVIDPEDDSTDDSTLPNDDTLMELIKRNDEMMSQECALKKVECRTCGSKVGDNSSSRNAHANTQHIKLPLFECAGCGEKWCSPAKSNVITHVRMCHDGDDSLIIDHRDRVRPQLRVMVELCFPKDKNESASQENAFETDDFEEDEVGRKAPIRKYEEVEEGELLDEDDLPPTMKKIRAFDGHTF